MSESDHEKPNLDANPRRLSRLAISVFPMYAVCLLAFGRLLGTHGTLLAIVPAILSGLAFGPLVGAFAGLSLHILNNGIGHLLGLPSLSETAVGAIVQAAMLASSGAVVGLISQKRREMVQRVLIFRRIEKALRLEEARMKAILDTAPDGIIICNGHGVIESANPAAEKMFRFRPEDLVGHGIDALAIELSSSLGRPPDPHGTELPKHRESIGIRRDGSYFPIDIAVSCLKFEGREFFIHIARDISDTKKAQSELYHLAHFDALTGLPNRVLFHQRLGETLGKARKIQHYFALLFLDLDGFKHVNDTLGHEAGDVLLREAAERFKQSVRGGDTVFRLGGDEFIIILDQILERGHAAAIASRIMSALNRPFLLYDQEIFVTTSVGICVFPDDGDTAEVLLRNADSAMYRSKEFGKNNFQFFTPDMTADGAERLRLANGLYRAIENQEFRLYYQPQVDISSGKVCGAEALLRWEHPEFGMVPPSKFIPIAEETGLIIQIGRWAMHEACEQLRRWRLQGSNPRVVAVNLSARQFQQDDLLQLVSEAIEANGLRPEDLELEITESMIMKKPDDAAEVSRRLRRLGVQLSIDDFGTGFSSLYRLQSFPLTGIKIDRAFVQNLGNEGSASSIVRSIISLGHGLGLRVIAEGVDTREQLEILRLHGCDIVQGYLLSKPVSPEQFLLMCQRIEEWFRRENAIETIPEYATIGA